LNKSGDFFLELVKFEKSTYLLSYQLFHNIFKKEINRTIQVKNILQENYYMRDPNHFKSKKLSYKLSSC